MQRIGEILPEVLENIEKRCQNNPNNKDFSRTDHRARVMSAIEGFMRREKKITGCSRAMGVGRI